MKKTLCVLSIWASLIAQPSTDAVAGEIHWRGDLKRQALLQFSVQNQAGFAVVQKLSDDSPAYAAGLRDGDNIIQVNGQGYASYLDGADLVRKLRGEEAISLLVTRDGRELVVTFQAEPRRLEKLEGVDSYYDVLTTENGTRLRTILTKPEGEKGPLPAIFFVQWVGCDTVQFFEDGPWIDVFRTVAEKSGRVFIRVERSANGDSVGPACHQLDFDTELSQYRQALTHFMKSEHVDASDVIVMANSLGSFMAPFVAAEFPVSGMVITSGGGLSYFERMLNFDRKYLAAPGKPPTNLHPELMAQVRLNVEYLLNGRLPTEIVRDNAAMAAAWSTKLGGGEETHYGRPFAYHIQAAAKNPLATWAGIQAPVLVTHSEFDQYETLLGAEAVVNAVNELRPNTADLVVLEGMGHSFYKYPSMKDAYQRKNRKSGANEVSEVLLNWLEARELGLGHEK